MNVSPMGLSPSPRTTLVHGLLGTIDRSASDCRCSTDSTQAPGFSHGVSGRPCISLVPLTLERFGFCAPGEAPAFVADGRIGPGGALPVNTSGGLLSEAHISGWNSIAEVVCQLRQHAGPRQIPSASHLQWATIWGDSIVFRR